MINRFRTNRSPSKRPLISAFITLALPLNSPVAEISSSRHSSKLASTLPSIMSRSQELISAESKTPRPTIIVLGATGSDREPSFEFGPNHGAAEGVAGGPSENDRSVTRGGISGGPKGPGALVGRLRSKAESDIFAYPQRL